MRDFEYIEPGGARVCAESCCTDVVVFVGCFDTLSGITIDSVWLWVELSEGREWEDSQDGMGASIRVVFGVAYWVLVARERYTRDVYTYNGFTARKGAK